MSLGTGNTFVIASCWDWCRGSHAYDKNKNKTYTTKKQTNKQGLRLRKNSVRLRVFTLVGKRPKYL